METKGKVKKKGRKLPSSGSGQDEDRALSPHSEHHEIHNQTRAKFDELLKSAMDQDASDSGKAPKKKKKARSQTAGAMLESLKKGGDLQKSFTEDTTALNNTFNAEDSPRYTKNTTNARRKKLPPKKGNLNRGYVDDEDDGMEMAEMGKDDGLKKKKKKTVKKKSEEDEEETAVDPTMTVSELEHTPKKPKRRRKKTREEDEEQEEQDEVAKETDEDQLDGEEGNGTPRGKGKKKKKKKKSTNLPMPTDDGQVLGVTVHRSDRLKPDLYIAHPLVRVHIVDLKTGNYVKKSSRERAVTSYYETKNENLEYILPILTKPFDFKKRKSMTPSWEDQIIFNESYQYLIQNRDDCPSIILLFEILDFVSMTTASSRPRLFKGQGTWHRIAWAFLKLVGANGAPNTEKKVRLQLFHPPFAYKAKPDQLDVFQWWENIHRQPYPATLYVTVKSIKPPQDVDPAARSLFATQEERGLMTYKELKETMSLRNKDQNLNRTNAPSLWSKLPGQTCRIPNKEILSLAGDKKGCHVIKFSPDGHHIACGCKDKDGYPILVYEIPSGREKCQFPGHYGLIYDIRWSPSGNDILTASSDGTARIWHIDMPDSAALKVFPHPSFVYTARYHPTYETFIITGGYDNFIRVWSIESNSQTGELMYELKGHEGFVNSIAFSPDGIFMYSGDSEGKIIVWKSAGSDGNWMMRRHVEDKELMGVPINSLQVHPSGRRVIVHCRDNHIRMLDLRLFCVMQNYIGVLNFREQIRSILSPCGSFVFSGSEDRHGYVWNTDTGEQVAAYTQLGYRQPVCDVDYHPHEHMVALCSRGEGHPIQVYIYDAKVAHLTMGFARTKLGKEAEDGNVTEEEERLVGTLRTKHDIDQDIEDKKHERLARVKRKLASVMAIQNPPSDLNQTTASMHTSGYAPGHAPGYTPGASAPYETWGSTFDYSTTPWHTQTAGTLGFTGGRGGPGFTSTPYKKGPMPTINLNAESDGKAIFTFKAPVVEDKHKQYNKVVALYNYKAQRSDELSLEVGYEITVLHKDNENWWMGQLANGQQGYFPANYVSYEGEEEDQTQMASRYQLEQSGLDETDAGSPKRRSQVKGQHRAGSTPKKPSKERFSAVTTKSGELKFISGAEDSEVELVSSLATPKKKKKKTVRLAANLDQSDVMTTDGESPRHARPPKGHSRSRTAPHLSSNSQLDDSQASVTRTPLRRKKLKMNDSHNMEDSGTDGDGVTPRSARLRRGSRENLLGGELGSMTKKGGKKKTKSKHLDSDESHA
ncbi:jouberin isoform X2 [Strongylocentrotus purpuratus]|uniref:SH3 domain-containing protein n=1 Tax=Strongylocentrotus purpuratus TaxID=7668 RepID=A0A7M7NIK9_STRPU|nr:jouberin isoform X2 [Strongylocentrotus purpuratus]